MVIEAPQMAQSKTRPTHLMEKVSKLLEGSTTPLSKNAVEKGVEGRREWVFIAIQILIDEKFIAIENGARNALNLRLLKPFREADNGFGSIESFDWNEADNA